MPDDKIQPKSPQVNPQAPIGPSKPAIHDAGDQDEGKPVAKPTPAPDRPNPDKPYDETRPGGCFINTRKIVVDAEGRPIEGLTVSKDGKIVEGPSKAKDE